LSRLGKGAYPSLNFFKIKEILIKNIIILGCGRSGTSMVAGCLSSNQYFRGEKLLSIRESNPKGFFEDIEINSINEAILESLTPKRPLILGNIFFRHYPINWQRWLAVISVNKKINSNGNIKERIKKVVLKVPYCFKDPRFSYTLPVWRPFLENVVFLCIFRNPLDTASSILKECKRDIRLHNLSINFRGALKIWEHMYRHIIEIHCKQGDWLFLHYNQVLQGEGLKKLESFTGAHVDHAFPDPALRHHREHNHLPESIRTVYKQLCKIAGYNP
jgi:hypothetical protein